MTAAPVVEDAEGTARASLGPALRGLVEATTQYAAARASDKVAGWTRRLDEIVSPSGITDRAAYEGVKALLRGDNPVIAAIKGGWLGASNVTRVLVVLVVVVALLLSPGLVLLVLLGLLVAAVVAGVRAAGR